MGTTLSPDTIMSVTQSGESDVPVYVIVLAGVGAFLGVVSTILACVLMCHVMKNRKQASRAKPPVAPPAYENMDSRSEQPNSYEQLGAGIDNHMYCDVVNGST